MKSVIILLMSLQAVLAAPVGNKVDYEAKLDNGIISYKSDLEDQSYSYRVETDDGSVKYESGRQEGENLVVSGGYEYIGDNGLKHSVTYEADEKGYRPIVSFGTRGTKASAPKTIKASARGSDAAFLGALVGGGIAKRSYEISKIIEHILFGR